MGREHAASFSWLRKLVFFKASVFGSEFPKRGREKKFKKKNPQALKKKRAGGKNGKKKRASRRAPALPRQVHQSTLCKESPALPLTSLARLMHSRGSRYGRLPAHRLHPSPHRRPSTTGHGTGAEHKGKPRSGASDTPASGAGLGFIQP